MSEVTVDFIARDQPHGGWALVLVEEGPWESADIPAELRRIQDRLYGCIDAALGGLVAEKFPDAVGKPLMIRLEAFDCPAEELSAFVARFATGVPKLPDYSEAITRCKYFPSIDFEVVTSKLPSAV